MRLASRNSTFEISNVVLKRDKMSGILNAEDVRQPRTLCIAGRDEGKLNYKSILEIPPGPTKEVQFACTFRISDFLGKSEIVVAMMSASGDVDDRLITPLPTIVAHASDLGDLNTAKDTALVTGWAINGLDPDQRVDIMVKDRENIIWKTRATLPRSDLADALGNDGFHGFAIPCGILKNIGEWRIEAQGADESIEILSGRKAK